MVYRWQLLAQLILHIRAKNVCEIGTSKGNNVWRILDYLDGLEYYLDNFYGVDPNLDPYFAMEPTIRYRLKKRPEFIFFETTSDDALRFIPELDLVFIDGEHSDKQITKDIINYTKLIRPGGIVCGDDYNDFAHGFKKTIDNVIKTGVNSILDKRKECGKDNYLWWVFVDKNKCYVPNNT